MALYLALFFATVITKTFAFQRIGSKEVVQGRFRLRSTVVEDFTSTESSAVAAEEKPRPGAEENKKFACDHSVERWMSFQAAEEMSSLENLRAAAAIPAKYVTTSPEAAKYWAAHVARTSYFLANAVAGTTAFELFKQSSSSASAGVAGFAGPSEGQSTGGALNDSESVGAQVASRLVLEAMMTYEQDWQCVARDDFKAPWDMEPFSNHRQQQPLYALRQSVRFVREAVGTLNRRAQGEAAKGIWLGASPNMGYPEYYQNNFHFQGDGW